MIQRCYSEDNIQHLFLSPYCNIRFCQDILELACWGQNEVIQLTLHCPEELLRALEDGCSIDNLAQMLMVQMECTYDEAVALIKLMVRRRILE